MRSIRHAIQDWALVGAIGLGALLFAGIIVSALAMPLLSAVALLKWIFT